MTFPRVAVRVAKTAGVVFVFWIGSVCIDFYRRKSRKKKFAQATKNGICIYGLETGPRKLTIRPPIIKLETFLRMTGTPYVILAGEEHCSGKDIGVMFDSKPSNASGIIEPILERQKTDSRLRADARSSKQESNDIMVVKGLEKELSEAISQHRELTKPKSFSWFSNKREPKENLDCDLTTEASCLKQIASVLKRFYDVIDTENFLSTNAMSYADCSAFASLTQIFENSSDPESSIERLLLKDKSSDIGSVLQRLKRYYDNIKNECWEDLETDELVEGKNSKTFKFRHRGPPLRPLEESRRSRNINTEQNDSDD